MLIARYVEATADSGTPPGCKSWLALTPGRLATRGYRMRSLRDRAFRKIQGSSVNTERFSGGLRSRCWRKRCLSTILEGSPILAPGRRPRKRPSPDRNDPGRVAESKKSSDLVRYICAVRSDNLVVPNRIIHNERDSRLLPGGQNAEL